MHFLSEFYYTFYWRPSAEQCTKHGIFLIFKDNCHRLSFANSSPFHALGQKYVAEGGNNKKDY